MYGARILVEDGAPVKENQDLVEWDPYTFSILTEISGTVHFRDLIEGSPVPADPPPTTFADGLANQQVLYAIRRAARDGAWITL